MTIPKNARELIDACLDSGWSILVQHGKDTGDSPFVSIEAAESRDGRKVRATWHTRGSGTYRMFSCVIGKRDASLRSAIAYVAEVAA
jgi:hypothetical protein